MTTNKFIHPNSKKAKKATQKEIRSKKLEAQKLNSKAQKRKSLGFLKFIQEELKENKDLQNNNISDKTINKLIIKYLKQQNEQIVEMNQNSTRVSLEIKQQQMIQEVKQGLFQIPNIQDEYVKQKLINWDCRYESSIGIQKIQWKPIDDIEYQNQQQDNTNLEIQIKKMEEQVNKQRKQAEELGVPFNERNYLRRLQRDNKQYFDSADYVLKHGWQGNNQQIYNQHQNQDIETQNRQPSRMAQCQSIEEESESEQ